MRSSTLAVGAVSFLNARPLVAGLRSRADLELVEDVPSRLLEGLLAGRTKIALCPTIDFQLSPRPLRIVPVGGIGSHGPTYTVRVFSRLPLEEVSRIHVDSDSHTSAALLEVVLAELHGRRPELCPLPSTAPAEAPEAVLLIGDKVVTASPSDEVYPFQLDLGEAWRRLTGLPFTFATWMALDGEDLGDLPVVLHEQRLANHRRLDELVRLRAPQLGWPLALAQLYLGTLIRYEIEERELQGMELFWRRCHELDLFPDLRALDLYAPEPASVGC